MHIFNLDFQILEQNNKKQEKTYHSLIKKTRFKKYVFFATLIVP